MSDPRYIRPGLPFAMAHSTEEVGEVMIAFGGFLAALGKSQRWGLASVNPELPVAEQETNAAWLFREITDLRGALDRLEQEMGVPPLQTVTVPPPSEQDLETMRNAILAMGADMPPHTPITIEPRPWLECGAAEADISWAAFWRGILPRFGRVPNSTLGLGDYDDPSSPDFDGWAFIAQWRRFVIEIVIGRRS